MFRSGDVRLAGMGARWLGLLSGERAERQDAGDKKQCVPHGVSSEEPFGRAHQIQPDDVDLTRVVSVF
jgi:hypothetical protein